MRFLQDFWSNEDPTMRLVSALEVSAERAVIKLEGQVELILFPAVHPCSKQVPICFGSIGLFG